MIFDDDGYGQFGGNGSVQWEVDVNVATTSHDSLKNTKGRNQGGHAKGGKNGNFTISLQVPLGKEIGDFKKLLSKEGSWTQDGKKNRLKFDQLPVEENTADQIRISWPKDKPFRRKTKGKKKKR